MKNHHTADNNNLEAIMPHTIRRANLLEKNQPVTVALSGGADSMALLFALLKTDESGEISAVHINHGLRGEESARDEQFVREQCAKLGVPLTVFFENVASAALACGEGVEEAGRRIRYERLASHAAKNGACIATAHTKSDNAETVLLHMTRGCGLRGLCGIPPMRYIEANGANIKVIRPLLDCSRAVVEDYCARNGIEYITDSTNADTTYSRNRIRINVMPQLNEINSAAEDAIVRMSALAADALMILDHEARRILDNTAVSDSYGGYHASALAQLTPALRSHAITLIISDAGHSCDSHQIKMISDILERGGAVSLNRSVVVKVSQDRMTVCNTRHKKILPDEQEAMTIIPGVSCTFYNINLTPRLMSLSDFEKEQFVHKNLLKNSCNYDSMCGTILLRSRIPGDSFRPQGRNVTKSLKKLFAEARVPEIQRDCIPIICDQNGIALVSGFGCDERVRIDSSTQTVFVLDITQHK